MHKEYITEGTCSKAISFDIDESNIVTNVRFLGGCPGNTTGLAQLAEGMKAEELIKRLRGIKCGTKKTSCPDQFSTALIQALENNSNKAK